MIGRMNSDTKLGIYLRHSSNNTIYHTNPINNTLYNAYEWCVLWCASPWEATNADVLDSWFSENNSTRSFNYGKVFDTQMPEYRLILKLRR